MSETNYPDENPETSVWYERLGDDYDELTGLRQRRSFEKIVRARKPGSFAILFIDMDGLKKANDMTESHSLGDLALRTISEELKISIRDRGAEGQDEAFRRSGDEFIIFLDKLTKPEPLSSVADRLCKSINSHSFEYEDGRGRTKKFKLSASIGGSVSVSSDKDVFDVVTRADKALYEAKKGGRNRHVVTK